MALSDDSKMPFGCFKGKKMIDVPGEYLLKLYDKLKNKKMEELDKFEKLVAHYIIEMHEAIKLEIKNKKKVKTEPMVYRPDPNIDIEDEVR